MKVQCLNSSALKTRNLIKKTFAELIHEKKVLSKVSVSELVRRASITRSTFYTHYDNIYQVVEEYKMQTIELLCNEELKLYSIEDILHYFDTIFACLKENEETYHLLLTSNDSLLFLDSLKKIAGEKIWDVLKDTLNDPLDQLSFALFMDGIIVQIINYYRGESKFTLDQILTQTKKCFCKLFA